MSGKQPIFVSLYCFCLFKLEVHSYPNSGLLRDFDAGTPLLVLDEGDSVLVISRNTTGEYENTPLFISANISAKWYYFETVYSAYTKNGRLLWRAAVDSSPDYGAWICKVLRDLIAK